MTVEFVGATGILPVLLFQEHWRNASGTQLQKQES